MAKPVSAKKLKRLVLAQTVAESMAKSQVGGLSARLAQVDEKLEKARNSFATTKTSMLFSDLHLKHINGLVRESEETRDQLEAARRELQSETVRNRKLQDRLKATLSSEEREAENKLLLERLERGSRHL
ncbi:MAG: hypothetical protein HRU27_07945 [Rhizobiaceae bacterium]|nr:hypothetical protein [Hyphomicrobiales bacterium]NRB30512.1 hypothetical protein [Rhizobiaceae bacterium]